MIGDELQRSIYAALTSANVAESRIYDQVPSSATFPYVTIGDSQVIDDSNSCGEAFEVFETIHVWSRPANDSKLELKALLPLVKSAILSISAVSGFTVQVLEFVSAQTNRDIDGETEHSVITFRFLLDPAS